MGKGKALKFDNPFNDVVSDDEASPRAEPATQRKVMNPFDEIMSDDSVDEEPGPCADESGSEGGASPLNATIGATVDDEVHNTNPLDIEADAERAREKEKFWKDNARVEQQQATSAKYKSAGSLADLLAMRPEGVPDIDKDTLAACFAAVSKQSSVKPKPIVLSDESASGQETTACDADVTPRSICFQHDVFEASKYECTSSAYLGSSWIQRDAGRSGSLKKGQVVRVTERRQLGDQSVWLRCDCASGQGWMKEEVEGKVMLMAAGQPYYAVMAKAHCRASWKSDSARTGTLHAGDVIAVTETHLIEETGEVRARFSQGWVSMNDMRKKSQVLKPMVATCEEPTPVQVAVNKYEEAGSVQELLAMRQQLAKRRSAEL
jgi:hypothetical protein